MLDIVAELDTEIGEIKKNTNRGITKFNTILIELSKKYANAKKGYIDLDTAYDISIIKSKRAREATLITEWQKRITDAELVRFAETDLMNDYKAKKEKFAEKEYLETIVTTYVNWANWYKFDIKSDTKMSSFMKWA